ncbi:hypothetical protein [Asaia lannensis]|uniref:hypothetical protein n=1 Tax=Asaia lannensis TaxID=415421 RepID=UPI0038734794
MKRLRFLAYTVPLLGALFGHTALSPALAAEETGPLPDSGVKSPYSPLAIPTTLKPLPAALDSYLGQGYSIGAIARTGPELVMTLSRRGSTLICALTPPDTRNDQNVPTSRCWSLNKQDRKP